MRLERSFGPHSPDAVLFKVSESARAQNNNLEQAITPREIILFSRVDKEKDTEAPDQTPEINQTTEPMETKPNGDWEPFSQRPIRVNRFFNLYDGNYAQDMEINRERVEQAIKVAGLEGDIVLTSLSYSRTRSLEANPDGSVAAKRGLLWGEKPEDAENPYHRATPIPEGWRIEICDQKIRDELSEKYSGEKLQKKFVAKFNQNLRAGIWEALWKEKLTAKKDSNSAFKLRVSLLYPAVAAGLSALGGFTLRDLYVIGFVLLAYGVNNYLSFFVDDGRYRRSLRSFYEYFMPPVEIDRIIRGLAFVNLKGRNLVRLRL